MTFLIRTIEALIYPIGLIWATLTISAIVLCRKKQRGAAFLCGLLSAFLYISGATPLPEILMARLERPYASATVANAQPADAVIVLGGIMNPSIHDTFGLSVTSAADRLITGVELLRQKKVRALIIGGGPVRTDPNSSEGMRIEQFVKTWNISGGEIIGLESCANTRQEAARVQALMTEHKWTNLILVTSAFHMARAMATFEKAGIKVRPVACDFEALPVVEGEVPAFRLVPIIDHIKNLNLYLHEVLGWYYYAARGWI